MSIERRAIETRVTVCDLCDQIIDKAEPDEHGSLTHGFLAHAVQIPKTKHAWISWPPPSRKRKGGARLESIEYDFHADCILKVVEDAIEQRPSRAGE